MIGLIVNTRAGGQTDSGQVMKLLERHALAAKPFWAADPAAAARSAIEAGADTLVGGGGDGTISAVASVAVEAGTTLGVLPLGTLNHFAKDLKIPLTLDGAVGVIAAGNAKYVDVGEVNGRTFINNSGLGLYPGLVSFRTAQQKRGSKRWTALLQAVMITLRRMPRMDIRLTADHVQIERRTPMIFVGNNQYEFEGVKAGTRTCIDKGLLSVSMTTARSGREVLWLSLLALVGRLRDRPEFEEFQTTAARVDLRRRRVRVSLDGEVTFLQTPLLYKIRPAALRVLVPREDISGR